MISHPFPLLLRHLLFLLFVLIFVGFEAIHMSQVPKDGYLVIIAQVDRDEYLGSISDNSEITQFVRLV